MKTVNLFKLLIILYFLNISLLGSENLLNNRDKLLYNNIYVLNENLPIDEVLKSKKFVNCYNLNIYIKTKFKRNFWLKIPLKNMLSIKQKKVLVSYWKNHNLDIYYKTKDSIKGPYTYNDSQNNGVIVNYFNLEPKESIIIYIKVKESLYIDYFNSLFIIDDNQLFNHLRKDVYDNSSSFLLGILVTMIFCGIILYLSTSLKSYLYYSMFILSVIMLSERIQGPLYYYFTGESKLYLFIFLKVIIPMFIVVSMSLFTKNIFNLNKNNPKLDLLINLIIIFSIILVLIEIVYVKDQIIPLYFLLLMPLFIFIGLRLIKEKNVTAIFYVFSIMIFIIPPVSRTLCYLFNIQIHPSIYNNILLSTTLCSIILSLATLTNLKDIIEKRKKFEKQVHLKSRFVAMGEMIANIAHQWRQPLNHLSTINISLYLHNQNKSLTSQLLEKKLTESNNQIKHMSDTIDDFMNFFSQRKEKTNFTFNSVLNDVLEFMNTSIVKNKITIKIETINEVQINTFKNEFFQVLLILITNAKDILKEKLDENRQITIIIDDFKMEIIDNGGGIKEDIIHKIFEPYFTTKLNKNGTGLGLYTAKVIVEDNIGGSLTVANKKNGADFTIDLSNLKNEEISTK